MVSRKNATSASERFIPICRPTALSSSGVGSFALAIGSSFTLERLGGRATSSPAPSALSRPARLPRAARSCSLPTPNGRAQMPSTKPHVVIVVADDMGYSDLGCFGGEIPTRRGFDRFFGTLSGCGSYYRPTTLARGEQHVESEGQRRGSSTPTPSPTKLRSSSGRT